MPKGFAGILKNLARPLQSEQQSSEEAAETRPQSRWSPDSESPRRIGLRSQRSRDGSLASSLSLLQSSKKRFASSKQSLVSTVTDNARTSTEYVVPPVPTIDPSMIFDDFNNDTTDGDRKHDDIPNSSFSIKGVSLEFAPNSPSDTPDTPLSIGSSRQSPSLTETPASSRPSERQSSRTAYDVRLSQTPSRTKSRHDSHSYQFSVFPDVSSKPAASPELSSALVTVPSGLELPNDLESPIGFLLPPACAASLRHERSDSTATDRSSSLPAAANVLAPAAPSGRRDRLSEDGQQSDSVRTASSMDKSARASARSSTMSQRRSSRRRNYSNAADRPNPLFLSSSLSGSFPLAPLTGPPGYPPPPNPVEKVEMRVQKLEEQIHLLNLKMATLTTQQTTGGWSDKGVI